MCQGTYVKQHRIFSVEFPCRQYLTNLPWETVVFLNVLEIFGPKLVSGNTLRGNLNENYSARALMFILVLVTHESRAHHYLGTAVLNLVYDSTRVLNLV
jgi:hypothetical protein